MSELHSSGDEKMIGITHDPVLRPVGILMAVVGGTWALFAGMAVEAGTYGQPLAAVGLMALGIILAGAGKPSQQV
jgi:hypothetical protein